MHKISLISKIFSFSLLLSFSYILTIAQSITVNVTDYKQTIDMIGGDMERSSKAVQTTVQNTESVIQWGFGDINFNYCRVQFDKNQELVEGTKNWSFYTNQIITMKQIKALNPDIKFYATMRSDYDGYGDENNMPDWIVDYDTKAVDTEAYAGFLADYLEYMEDQGVAIHTLATHKEWGAFITATVSRDIILALKDICTTRGITMPKINDNGAWSMAQGLDFMNGVESLGTQDLYDGFSSHEYASNDTPEAEWPTLVAKAESLGKKMYQDETITGSSETGVAPVYRYAQRAVLYQSGLCGEIFFEIWSRGINSEHRAIYWTNGGTASRYNGYYVMKHFANNVLGSQYITATAKSVIGGEFSVIKYGGVTKMAFRKDNKVMLWVMNLTSSVVTTEAYPTMTINIENGEIDGNVENVRWIEGSDIEGVNATIIPTSLSSFQANIEENTINVFTFNVKDNALSNNEVFKDTDIKISVNPVQNELVTNKTIQSFRIVSLNGVVVKIGEEETTNIDISNLSAGLYVFQGFTCDNQLVSHKFFK